MIALGFALVTLGAVAMVAQSQTPSLGMLGGPGIVAVAAGSVLAVNGFGGSLGLGLIAALVLSGSASRLLWDPS